MQLTREMPEFEKHSCRIICFIQSDKDEIKQQVVDRQKQHPSFIIVAGPSAQIYK